MKLPIEIDAGTQTPLGMSPSVFLSAYWQKRPLLIRQAFADFAAPLTAEDLAGLSCEDAAVSRIVLHDRDDGTWRLRHGPFPEAMFPQMPERDWTLLVQDVDKWDGDVAGLLEAFAFLPSWRIDDIMVSFAAPGGSVGPHVDQYDVFLLQGPGRRRWRIDTRPGASTELVEDSELSILKEFQQDHEWILEAGDMLYLPPGVPHFGEALDACLTFSIGMRAPSSAELVLGLAEHLADSLPDSRRYTDPDLIPAGDRNEIAPSAIPRVRAAIGALDALDDAALAGFFGTFITRYRSAGVTPPARPMTAATLAGRLAKGARMSRHEFARLAWTRVGRRAVLFADGEAYPMAIASARRLCRTEAVDQAAFAALDGAGRAAVLALLHRGILRTEPARRKGR